MLTLDRVMIGVSVIFGLLALSCLGLTFIPEALLTLAFGWVFYVRKTWPQVRIDPAGLATALVCLMGFAAGGHVFLHWVYREVRGPDPGVWRFRWTAQTVAVVVLMFVAGLATTGVAHQVGWLVTAPEPLLAGSSSAARRAQSVNNLKQIGIAVWNIAEATGEVPAGATTDDVDTLLHSWQTTILPYLEQQKLFDQIHLTKPWDDLANLAATKTNLWVYRVPGVAAERDGPGRGLSHYEGNAHVVGGTRGLRIKDVVDGTSNTILAGESAGGYQPWAKPGHWRDPADGISRDPARGFGSPFPGGANLLMLDGSVKFLRNTTHPKILKALSTPAGAENTGPDPW